MSYREAPPSGRTPRAVRLASVCDVGLGRAVVADDFRALRIDGASTDERPTSATLLLDRPIFLAVADAMGGTVHGVSVASEALHAMVRSLQQELTIESGAVSLERAFQAANAMLLARGAGDDPSWRGVAVTATALLVVGPQAWVAQAGNTQIYTVDNGLMTTVIEPHLLVRELLRTGRLPREEAESFPDRNIVTRGLGLGTLEVDMRPVDFMVGKRVLLCSNGVWDVVARPAAEEALRHEREVEACAALRAATYAAGAPDNLVAVVATAI